LRVWDVLAVELILRRNHKERAMRIGKGGSDKREAIVSFEARTWDSYPYCYGERGKGME
jgi:hypothetical protein